MKFDETFLEKSQAAYLWLYDRTGTYVATVGMASIVIADAAVVWHRSSTSVHTFIGLAFVGFMCSVRYWLQNAEKYELFNALAREWQASKWRIFLLWVWLIIFLTELLGQRWLPAVSSSLNFLFFNYVLCWQIRKREPPEKLVFARQNAS